MTRKGYAPITVFVVLAWLIILGGIAYVVTVYLGMAYGWLFAIAIVCGGVGILTIFLNLFSSLGDHPDKRWATEIPEVDSEEFLSAISHVVNASIEPGESVKILNNGKDFLPALMAAIKSAKQTINITVYIWKDGKMSTEILDELIEKANAGVEVRIMLDAVGGLQAPQERLEELEKAGGRVEVFRPPYLGKITRFHRRTHRRAIVIDGRVGFTGGMAIDDQWLGNANNEDQWRDMMFEVKGRMAQSLQGVFAQIWSGTVGEILVGEKFYPEIYTDKKSTCRYLGIASSPSADSEPLQPFYWLSISAARKTLYLTYPYAVPDAHTREALIKRAEEGVDVRLLLPGKIDDKPTQWASSTYYGKFLQAGIKIYEYKTAVLHSKILTVDGKWSIIGSANLDIRSKKINEENVLGVLDTDLGEGLDKVFFKDLARAKEILYVDWERRGIGMRLLEWVFGVFTKQY